MTSNKNPEQDMPSANNSIMSAIAAASLDALITINAEGNIIEFGPVAEDMFGYSRDEVMGMSVAEVVIPPRLRQAHTDGMAKYHNTGEGPVINTRIEVPAIRRNGEEFPAELTVVPLEVEGEKLFTAFVRDITDQKKHEEEMEAARNRAEEANRAKSRFLAHMTHELRSPLTTVLGAVDILLESNLDSRQSQFASMARSSGNSLLDLISDILDFSKIESGDLDTVASEINLKELIAEIVDAASEKARERQINLDIYYSEMLPEFVTIDAKRLRQVLINFLDNAIKFTSEGGVYLNVTPTQASDDKVEILFSVKDTGIGIPEEKSQTIFEEFSQVDNSDSTAYSGAGLGLAIVKLIAEKIGGTVGMNSTEGQGSEFWFKAELPCREHPDTHERMPSSAHAVVVTQNPLTAECLKNYLADIQAKSHVVSDMGKLDERLISESDFFLIDMRDMDASCNDMIESFAEKGMNMGQIAMFMSKQEIKEHNVPYEAPCRIIQKPFMGNDLYDFIDSISDSRQGEAETATHGTTSQEKTRPRVLLAEDSASNQLVLKAMLESDYEVTTVENGDQALSAVKAEDFDVILMDLRMPGTDGIRATELIRQLDGDKSRMPIIALTANAMSEDIKRCMDVGMDEFIAKPVNKPEFLQKIADVIASH